jgi:hypothetical protein
MAENNNIKNTIKKKLDVISGSTSSFFTGVDDLINLQFDPIVTGYAFIWWIQLPSWFEKDPDLKFFKEMTQKNFRAFSGVDDIMLTTVQQQTGFANAEFDIAAGITRGNTAFTLRHKEYSGGVMRKLYQKWITMIRDPRTGIALYPKLFDVDYGARNHTGQLLYVVVRPDATNTNYDIVEYAAFYSNVMPMTIPLSTLYNFEIGSQESPNIDIEFRGFVEVGPDVEEYAKKILREEILRTATDGNGIPFLDSFGSNPDAKEVLTPGTLKDIYRPDEE